MGWVVGFVMGDFTYTLMGWSAGMVLSIVVSSIPAIGVVIYESPFQASNRYVPSYLFYNPTKVSTLYPDFG